jgi:cellulose synthase/poly-beta-1,6-N-acetylglucosamine synthase-like glycosyltransferase
MTTLALILIAIPILLGGYAYLGYPALLALLPRRHAPAASDPDEWPDVTISLPVHNEERVVGSTIESLLALDYPPERRHILVLSDCSTDRTDDIAASYADRGLKLVRLPERRGKTAAENEAAHHVQGNFVVNTDATTRIHPAGLKVLMREFQDPTVGVASGRDVSVSADGTAVSSGESGYVGYEMWVRDLETRQGGIVGASGCFFAIRRSLFLHLVPEALSRDFASPLIAREHGFRAVSVPGALCYVPRARSLRVEFRRKTRTMARGLETLWFKRHLLNPLRYGGFAFMLISHKLVRWLAFLTAPLAVLGLLILTPGSTVAASGLLLSAVIGLMGAAALRWPEGSRPPRPVALAGFLVGTSVAALLAWGQALRGERNPIWEPTRR